MGSKRRIDHGHKKGKPPRRRLHWLEWARTIATTKLPRRIRIFMADRRIEISDDVTIGEVQRVLDDALEKYAGNGGKPVECPVANPLAQIRRLKLLPLGPKTAVTVRADRTVEVTPDSTIEDLLEALKRAARYAA